MDGGHHPRGTASAVVAAALATALAGSGCRSTYSAPEATPPPRLGGLPAGPGDSGDILRMTQAESSCRGSLTAETIVASVQAVEDVTTALSTACDVLLEDEDPLAWRVWCRSDALFRSGHYLRSSTEPFDCAGTEVPNAFACIGRILGQRILAPGFTDRVELVTVGHVDLQPVALGGAFARDGCVDLQAQFRIRNRWAALDLEETPVDERFPDDQAREDARQEWNDRLAWCRAAYAATEIMDGIADENARSRGQVDLAVLGMGPEWLSDRGVCPTTGAATEQCVDARRVDILLRFVPTTRDVVSRCDPPPAAREDESERALWCYEDCLGAQNVGQLGQTEVAAGGTPPLFAPGSGRLGNRWVLHRAAGPTSAPLHVGTVRDILGMAESGGR